MSRPEHLVPQPDVGDTRNAGKLQEIPRFECVELLERHSFGRISIVVGDQPQIFPVNYAMSGNMVVFRTGSGTKLSHAPDSKVAFEIDGYDPEAGEAWSVMVQGVARDATDSFDPVSWAARAASPHPLAPGGKPFRLAIEPTQISGRRFRV